MCWASNQIKGVAKAFLAELTASVSSSTSTSGEPRSIFGASSSTAAQQSEEMEGEEEEEEESLSTLDVVGVCQITQEWVPVQFFRVCMYVYIYKLNARAAVRACFVVKICNPRSCRAVGWALQGGRSSQRVPPHIAVENTLLSPRICKCYH